MGWVPAPTDVELESLAQTWSEHCKHKIFQSTIDYEDEHGSRTTIRSLFKSYIVRATEEIGQRVGWLRSVFHDNAGVIAFNDEWNLVMKVETHNTPSALDPYGGAITGILGVNRDPFGTGMGCRLLFNTDVLCFAPPDYSQPLPGRLLHSKRIFEGVHRGIKDGANQSGIPDVNGAVVFDERFSGKPLVFCGTGGLMPSRIGDEPAHLKEARGGDYVVMGRRPHRQRRHPRRDVFIRRVGRGVPGLSRADRRRHYAEEHVRHAARSARPPVVSLHHRQRRRRPVILGGRNGPLQQRL